MQSIAANAHSDECVGLPFPPGNISIILPRKVGLFFYNLCTYTNSQDQKVEHYINLLFIQTLFQIKLAAPG